jgi:hypothetical protein
MLNSVSISELYKDLLIEVFKDNTTVRQLCTPGTVQYFLCTHVYSFYEETECFKFFIQYINLYINPKML